GRKTHHTPLPAGSRRYAATSFAPSTECTSPLRPPFLETPPEPHARQETWTQFPVAARRPALFEAAKSSIRSQRPARTRSLLQSLSSRAPRTVSAPPARASSKPHLFLAQPFHRVENPAALPRNFFVARPGNLQFILFRTACGMHQVRMRVHKSRQRHAPAQIDLLCRPRFRQFFHFRPRPDSRDQTITHQQRAIFD